MPEGDTIHRTANRLRPVLVGSALRRLGAARLAGDRPRVGETITSVDAVGKHLFIGFSGGLTLETHMKMTGSWHLYRTGEIWRKPAHLSRVEIEVDDWVAVCFSAPVVRIGVREALGRSDPGPDLCTPDADIDEAARRLAALGADLEVADALLDQRIACGVGNVYKSEVLWSEQVSPFVRARTIDDALATRLLTRASKLLLANLGTGRRTTVPGGLSVYGLRGRPCRRCGTRISSAKQGAFARVTYWCSRCQGAEPRMGRAGRVGR